MELPLDGSGDERRRESAQGLLIAIYVILAAHAAAARFWGMDAWASFWMCRKWWRSCKPH